MNIIETGGHLNLGGALFFLFLTKNIYAKDLGLFLRDTLKKIQV